MDWIKKHYDRFALLALAVILLASCGLLIWRTRQFPQRFTAAQTPVPHNSKVAVLESSALDQAQESLRKPASWDAYADGDHFGSLFVSLKYLVSKNGDLVNPLDPGNPPLHPPVPNEWFLKHNIDILDGNGLNEDPDGDGFSNLDEYLAHTDPQDKNAHPPYITKLRVRQFISQPFRLKFAAYDGDTYQINTLDLRQPSQFLKLGDPVAGTKFKLLKFEQKKTLNKNTGVDSDVSELTLQNVETQNLVVLTLDKIVDSPDSFALFKFLWDGSELKVKKQRKFSLKVEPAVEYKLIDIQENEAVITNLKTNERITVPRLEATAH